MYSDHSMLSDTSIKQTSHHSTLPLLDNQQTSDTHIKTALFKHTFNASQHADDQPSDMKNQRQQEALSLQLVEDLNLPISISDNNTTHIGKMPRQRLATKCTSEHPCNLRPLTKTDANVIYILKHNIKQHNGYELISPVKDVQF